jgi:hypothetical protein
VRLLQLGLLYFAGFYALMPVQPVAEKKYAGLKCFDFLICTFFKIFFPLREYFFKSRGGELQDSVTTPESGGRSAKFGNNTGIGAGIEPKSEPTRNQGNMPDRSRDKQPRDRHQGINPAK